MYPGSTVSRLKVPDDKKSWDVMFYSYDPPNYTSPVVMRNPVWADQDVRVMMKMPKYNQMDKTINRISHHGNYKIVGRYPLNPLGRTGLRGRGLLGRWGPNHAADPIVSRWKRNHKNEIVKDEKSGKNILQIVVIQRKDNGSWAIPGGMVDPGEKVSTTLRREFSEEALNSLSLTENEKEKLQESISNVFNKKVLVYKGIVKDGRNTDNAWIETVACSFHDDTGESVGKFSLAAGDDAARVKWVDASEDMKLHGSHNELVSKVCHLLNAHW